MGLRCTFRLSSRSSTEVAQTRRLPVLEHLSPDLSRPLRDSFGTTKAVVLDAFRMLAVKTNLEHHLNQSLIGCVNLALHSIYTHPLTLVPYIYFA